MGESTTGGYTLLDIPKTKQTLIHVHQGAEELGRVYSADLPIVSGMPEMVSALVALKPPAAIPWSGAIEAAHDAYLAWRKPGPCSAMSSSAKSWSNSANVFPPMPS